MMCLYKLICFNVEHQWPTGQKLERHSLWSKKFDGILDCAAKIKERQ